MTWTDLSERWHEIVPHLHARWPGTDPETLRRIAGDRAALARHLAAATDLTADEAAEAVEDWLLLA